MTTPMETLKFDYINPIKCIYHQPMGPQYIVPHWHDEIELVYVEKGNPGVMYIEGQKYDLRAGQVYIINTRLIHSFDITIELDQRLVTLLINYDWLQYCAPKMAQEKHFELIGEPKKDNQAIAFSQLKDLINHIKDDQALDESEGKQLHQLATAVQLISILVKHFTVDKKATSDIPSIIYKIIEQFQNQYQTDIQLSTIAKEYNYSYAYFSKFFKKYLGISPKRYLTLLRIQRAAELVEKTDEKFSQIAADTGFPDEKSFYASFKAQYQQTPHEYRQEVSRLLE